MIKSMTAEPHYSRYYYILWIVIDIYIYCICINIKKSNYNYCICCYQPSFHIWAFKCTYTPTRFYDICVCMVLVALCYRQSEHIISPCIRIYISSSFRAYEIDKLKPTNKKDFYHYVFGAMLWYK